MAIAEKEELQHLLERNELYTQTIIYSDRNLREMLLNQTIKLIASSTNYLDNQSYVMKLYTYYVECAGAGYLITISTNNIIEWGHILYQTIVDKGALEMVTYNYLYSMNTYTRARIIPIINTLQLIVGEFESETIRNLIKPDPK